LYAEITLSLPQSGYFCRQNDNGEKVNTEVEWMEDVNTTPMPALIA
jgi:hypothetical protein